jgi:antitoxin CptB
VADSGTGTSYILELVLGTPALPRFGRAARSYWQIMPEPLEIRRKRLIHHSLYTGMKETDLLLGAFARRHVPGFSAAELDEYERLLREPDPDLFDWATGRLPVPARCRGPVMSLLMNFKDID